MTSECRRDLISFSKYIKEDYQVEEFHETIAEALMKVESWEIKRLAIEMPPRSWKSKLACINFPARVLGRNPYAKIVVGWYWKELPVEFSKEARNIVKSKKYQSVFTVWLETEKVDHWRTYSPEDVDKDPDKAWYYHATWIWWWLTWYWWDILIVDDPVKNREEAESPAYRNKVWNRYTSTLSTRFSDQNSAIIVIMTRWHVDDLRGRIDKVADKYLKAWIDPEERTVISIPSLTRNEEVPSHEPNEMKKWISFRPSKFGVEYLVRKRIDIGIRDFAALYQQNPLESTGSIFKPQDFRYAKLSDFEIFNWKTEPLYRKEHIELWMFVDPAFSTDTDSDEASVGIVGRHIITDQRFVFDVYSWTSAPSVTIDYMFSMVEKRLRRWFENFYWINIEYVQLNKDQVQFVQTVEDEMQKRNQRYTVHKWIPTGKKDDRIKFSIDPILTNHKLFFLEDQIPHDQMIKIVEQLQQFPTSDKKDVIDMISQAMIVFRNQKIQNRHQESNKEPKTYVNKITWQEDRIQNQRSNKF